MHKKKVCMLGSFAVGKTSLVQRFVTGGYSERYHTTVGVKIDTALVEIGAGRSVQMLLWDLHGDDDFQRLPLVYLRGAAGLLFVADGTRPATLERATQLRASALAMAGPVPCRLALNKQDLRTDWKLGDDDIARLDEDGWQWAYTSAREDVGVSDLFHSLCGEMVSLAP